MKISLVLLVTCAASVVVIVSTVWAQGGPPGSIQYLPADIKWVDNPALPPGGQMAVLVGKPVEANRYAFRIKFPPDLKVMPHSHPEERIYTVISGTWYIGLGDRFDPAQLKAFPAGSLYVVPAGVSHFHWAKSGESIVQVNGTGPTATDYADPADDPRRK